MATSTPKRLAMASLTSTLTTSLYTVPSSTFTRIEKLHVSNGLTAGTITVYLNSSGYPFWNAVSVGVGGILEECDFILNTGDSLLAGATTTTGAILFLFGVETANYIGTTTPKRLAMATLTSTLATLIYTCPAGYYTRIEKVRVSNGLTAGTVTIYVNSSTYPFWNAISIGVGGILEEVDLILNSGDTILAGATTATTATIFLFGTETVNGY